MEDSLAKLEKEMRAMTRRTEAGVERCHVCGDETLGRSIILTFDALASRLSRLRERLLNGTPQVHSEWPTELEELATLARFIAGDET